MVYDLIIIGAGPAGVTAAIYAKRSGMNFLLFEKSCIGGNVVNAYEIENYTGVKKMMGADLALEFSNQLGDLGVDVNYDEVIEISKSDDIFKVKTTYSGIKEAKKVLLALGTSPRKLGLDNEEHLLGRGISFCATCDGAFYKGKDVLVVGGGNSALSEALYLSKIVNTIYLITRHYLKGTKAEISKVNEAKNIKVIEYKSVKEILEENNKVVGVKLIDINTKEVSTLSVNGIFVYIGQIPPTKMLESLAVLDDKGFIKVDSHFETSVKGLFAIGDCIEKDVRQIVTATGDAATAIHFINE